MRLTRVRIVAAAVGLAASGTVAGIVVAATPAAAGPTSASSASATTPKVVLVNQCTGKGQVRPKSFDPGCMPSNSRITGMSWTSWGHVAFGHATFKINNCTPSCAQGKFVSHPILTVLWRARSWPSHPGREYFTRLTVIFTGAHHPHGPAAQTLPPLKS